MAKGKKTGGRTKGSRNKRNLVVEEIAARFDLDPFEVLMMVASGDWKGLGYDAKTKVTFTPQGIEVEEDNVPLPSRVQAAKEASKYLYAQKQSVAISTEDSGVKIIVEDYTSKTK
jgi:hypothetical protein